MKLKAMFAAVGLVVAAMGVSGTAEARDRWDHHDRHDRWDRDDRHDRWGRHDRRHWRDDRRWDRGRHWGHHRVKCWREWHHGHRVRVCR